ncbi:hypothetical protein QJQ45_020290, partial [Haematococcus lacustris]
VRPGTPAAKLLDGYIMSTLFYEPSTRTRLSFESAMTKLGGTVISTESAGEYSSAAKGETLEDTIRTVEGYADCIVLRHFQVGAQATLHEFLVYPHVITTVVTSYPPRVNMAEVPPILARLIVMRQLHLQQQQARQQQAQQQQQQQQKRCPCSQDLTSLQPSTRHPAPTIHPASHTAAGPPPERSSLHSPVLCLQEGSARRAAGVAKIPILNAGDGPGQHPSQALLDVYTIQREVGRLDNIRIGMVGDLLNGRTVRSLAMVLSMYPGLQVYFVAPPVVAMKEDIKTFLTQRGVAWKEVEDLAEVAAEVDVLYQTRIQKERFTNMQEYAQARGKYIIDVELMKKMKKHAVIMHPLPRVDEISTEVDDDPRAAYFRQARNGLYVRMALVKLAILGR